MNFDVDAYLSSSPFKAVSVFRKGESPPNTNPAQPKRLDSGIVVMVSEDAQPGVSGQIGKALSFIQRNEKELNRLKQLGIDRMLLDFRVQVGDSAHQSDYLPPELVWAMARFRMGLVVSTIQPARA